MSAHLVEVWNNALGVGEEQIELGQIGVLIVVDFEPAVEGVLRQYRRHVSVEVSDGDPVLGADLLRQTGDVVDGHVHEEDRVDVLLLLQDLEDVLLPLLLDHLVGRPADDRSILLVPSGELAVLLLPVQEAIVELALQGARIRVAPPP